MGTASSAASRTASRLRSRGRLRSGRPAGHEHRDPLGDPAEREPQGPLARPIQPGRVVHRDQHGRTVRRVDRGIEQRPGRGADRSVVDRLVRLRREEYHLGRPALRPGQLTHPIGQWPQQISEGDEGQARLAFGRCAAEHPPSVVLGPAHEGPPHRRLADPGWPVKLDDAGRSKEPPNLVEYGIAAHDGTFHGMILARRRGGRACMVPAPLGLRPLGPTPTARSRTASPGLSGHA